MKASKQQIKAISYIDIIVGAPFLILTVLGGISLLLMKGIELPNPGVIDYIFSIFIGSVMIISGIILIESKLKKNPKAVGWLTSIFGAIAIFMVIMNIILNPETYTRSSIIAGSIIAKIDFLLMVVSGYYLRKLL